MKVGIKSMTLTDSETDLLRDSVDKDINLYGSGFRVYVIYKQDVITRYVEADKPVKDEGEDQLTYSIKLQKYKKKIKRIQGVPKRLMTLGELQDVLSKN